MKPEIRCGLTADGHIEAATYPPKYDRLILNRCTNEVLRSTAREGTDMFRWLVTAARSVR